MLELNLFFAMVGLSLGYGMVMHVLGGSERSYHPGSLEEGHTCELCGG